LCEVRFGSVLRFQLGAQKTTFLPEMKTYMRTFSTRSPRPQHPDFGH
jgi:hypothetical protein